QGQTYELSVSVPDGPMDQRMIGHLEEAFGQEHLRTYGHRAGPDEPVELVTIQVVGRGIRTAPAVPDRILRTRAEPTPPPPRQAYFGAQYGWLRTPVMRRGALAVPLAGPVIVEEYDATCVIPPGWRASLDAGENILIERM